MDKDIADVCLISNGEIAHLLQYPDILKKFFKPIKADIKQILLQYQAREFMS